MSVTAFPLCWPAGWPRTEPRQRRNAKYRPDHAFPERRFLLTFAQARLSLLEELGRLGATEVVLSSNHELRLDGEPRARARVPADGGVAVYFVLKGRARVMACDLHVRAAENVRLLTYAIASLRRLQEAGESGLLERAFEGFVAAGVGPVPDVPRWSRILGIPPGASRADIRAAYRRLAAERHPDRGGSTDLMAELNAARAEALRSRD